MTSSATSLIVIRVNIAELVQVQPEHRAVGVTFPDRRFVVAAAKRIYLELGVPCDLHETSISVDVPRSAASWYMGLLERATGFIGFNEWDRA